MMTVCKVMWFEFLYQIKSKFYLLGILIALLFLWSEFSPYIQHYPVEDNNDIRQLYEKGIHPELLHVDVSPEETLTSVLQHIDNLPEGILSPKNYNASKELTAIIKAQNLPLEQANALVKHQYPSFAPQWEVYIEEKGQRLGSIEEVQPVFKAYYEQRAFSSEFAVLWVDRLQIIMSFLSIPAFLMLFFKDRRFNALEWLHAKPFTGQQYVIGKYFGTVTAWSLPAVLVSTVVNIWIGVQVTAQAYNYHFTNLPLGLLICVLPTFMISGAIIVLLGCIFQNEVAALPVFLLYLIYNITSGVFMENDSTPWSSIKYMIRLDESSSHRWMEYLPHQGVVLGLSILFVLLAGRLWPRQGLKGKGRLTS
ncbi:ABC transporter permease [Paenibacillus lentus]|uniref:Uncharacterized protein n=1 Tax=Paenibacillus lentus TaxID=1338368 RepID=A0A3Q8S4R5_9BACL|nr:ABC transporter permease [Paenibacillus lentus]AZK46662.1 hypothetical protein EIM92_11270 [Paenibacillus lentus]